MSNRPSARLAAAALAAFAVCSGAFARESGRPLISLFRQEVHKGGTQNFDVARDQRGRLYFANLDGVLVYDGAWWSRVPVRGRTAFRLVPDRAGNIGVGALDDLGILRPGPDGRLRYESLVSQLPKHLQEGLGQPTICADAGGNLLYATPRLVARWDGTVLRLLREYNPALTRPPRCFTLDERTWIASADGMEDFGTGQRKFAGKRIDLLLPDLVVVRKEGLFHFDEKPYDGDAAAWLRGKTVTDGKLLRDGRIAIVTLRDGLLILTRDRRIDQIINADAGLPDEFAYAVAEDSEGALWLGTDSAIARIDVATPLTVLDNRVGLRGGIQALARHAGTLYAGTPHGVFAIDATDTGAKARRMEGDLVPWSLLSAHGELLVGAFNGLYVHRGKTAPQKIAGTEDQVVYTMLQARRDPSLVWLGLESGLAKLRRNGDAWQFDGAIAGTPQYIRWLVEQDGVLWIGSDVEGAASVGPDGNVKRYGTGDVEVLTVDGRVVFLVRDQSFMQLDPKGRFTPDPLLGHVRVAEGFTYAGADAAGNVWLGSRPPRLVRRLANGRYDAEPQATASMEGDVEVFYADPDGVMWLGSERGLYRVAPAMAATMAQPEPVVHRVVTGNDRVVMQGNGSRAVRVELPHNFGRVRVEVAPLSYGAATSYQYRLDPIDEAWTPWTAQAFLDFTTLAPGDYTFRVRTRGASGRISEEARWSFTVLAPWYATWWAIALWLLVAAAAVAAIVMLRTRALRRRAARLTALVHDQTVALREMVAQLHDAKEALVDKNALLEGANEQLQQLSLVDPLTGVSNRRYFDRALSEEFESNEPLSLILADLDHFKVLNDTRGHTAGDECLRRVAEYLNTIIRGTGDVVARWGGEEFAVLLRGADEDTALAVAERLRAGIETHGVTASFGVATRTKDALPQTLIERADRALYAAKRAGRNRVHVDSGTWRENATA